MGRNAQPIELIKAKGRSNHLTKAEIERRKSAEIKLGEKDLDKLVPPDYVKNNVTAFKHWKQHIKEYKEAAKEGIELLTSADVSQFALYCRTFSEYESLISFSKDDLDISDYLKLETAINKKMDMLIKMQDRLFLNPLARIRNVPIKKKKEPENPADEFGI